MYLACPACKTVWHIRIDNAIYATNADWLKDRFPDLPSNQLPEQLCFRCFQKEKADHG